MVFKFILYRFSVAWRRIMIRCLIFFNSYFVLAVILGNQDFNYKSFLVKN